MRVKALAQTFVGIGKRTGQGCMRWVMSSVMVDFGQSQEDGDVKAEHGIQEFGSGQERTLVKAGNKTEAIESYARLLRQCGNARDLCKGERVHQQLVQDGLSRDRFLGNLLVEMYGKCARLEDGRAVFDGMRRKNVVTWTLMAAAYVQNGHERDALQLYRRMCVEGVKADAFTIVAILSACSNLGSLADAKGIHANIAGSEVAVHLIVGNSLLSMYAKCGSVRSAREVFDGIPMCDRNVVSWNAMLAAYAQHNRGLEALELYRCMQQEGLKPDNVTFVSVIDACASLGALAEGKLVHGSIVASGFQSDVIVGNTLVNMYGKCKSCNDARSVFDQMQVRNVISWTAMIAAYDQNGHYREALELFQVMDVKPDKVVFVSVLDACANLSALEQGKAVHERAREFESSAVVGNGLVHMYGKCGALEHARRAFEKISWRDAFSWSVMVAAYAQNGHDLAAVDCFQLMQVEGVEPNEFAFTSVLYACSHLGSPSEARSYFHSMSTDHKMVANIEHYGCIVDVLGRLGRLTEAEALVHSMPFQPDAVTWLALLGACKMHGDTNRGAVAADHVVALELNTSASYVLLSNIWKVERSS